METKDFNRELTEYLKNIESDFAGISEERKSQLKKLSDFIQAKKNNKQNCNLIFICTHNSRRSHLSQIWAQVAAYYYGVHNVFCYSGGTEATAFNPRSVKALRKSGLQINQTDTSDNPVYIVKFANDADTLQGFSKKYDHEHNPQSNFAAIMTCSHADENCPFIPGADARIPITYKDPKESDNTTEEEQTYDERCKQIAVEMFYVFSIV